MGNATDNLKVGETLTAAEALASSGLVRREAMLAWTDIAPYGIFTTDVELRVQSWNRWLETHSGLTESSVVGRSILELYPEIRERRLDQHFERAIQGEVTVLSTALHRHLIPLTPTNRDFDVPYMLQTARVGPLPTVGTIVILEDVTQRECQALILRRQQEHDRLLSTALGMLLSSETPLEVAAELFPRIAAPLKLEAYFNFLVVPGTTEMRLHAAAGITPEVRRALTVADTQGCGPCSMVARTRQPVVLSKIQSGSDPVADLIRKIGLQSYVGFPLTVGDRLIGTVGFGSYSRETIPPEEIALLSTIGQYLAVALDRALRENALREARQRLAEHAEALETKVADRTAKLHETIQQLESFSYTIAHDLRAPIRSLKGFSEVLRTDYADALPEEAQMIIQRLQRASHRLDELTRDLLKFSKIVRADVQLEPIDLAALVDDIVLLTPALQNDVVVIQPPLATVLAQRTLLHQCLSNLFDNALKFASPGQHMRIVVRCELHEDKPPAIQVSSHPFSIATAAPFPGAAEVAEGKRCRIWVEDNGIGIPPGAHEKIFGIFERVSGLNHVEGTGIGLAIVARAMQQMGGHCGVESALGRGARFWLDLAVP